MPKITSRASGGEEDTVDVAVNMTAAEFLEFMAWKKDHDTHKAEMAAKNSELEFLAKKICWAIDADAKRPGKVKLIDQDHAAELLEQAKEFLA